MEEEKLWCLGLGAEDTDYILCEWDEDLLPKLYKQDEIRYEYNQGANDRSRLSCTIFSAIWMLSDLMNYPFEYAQIKEIDEESYITTKYPKRLKWNWRFTKYAVWLSKDRWNASKMAKELWQVAYYRINKRDLMVEYALDNLYTLDTNMCPTKEYNSDFKTDGILDGSDFWKNTNWHAIDIIKDNGQRSVKDNYKWRKTYDGKKECNIYELKHELKDLTNYSEWLYIFTKVKEDNLERIKQLNEIKSRLLQWIPLNSELRHLTWSKTYKDKLHSMNDTYREWLEYINNELKKLN